MGLKMITFIDNKGEILEKKNITALTLKESEIINKSIEMFGDPEPCILHKTCAMKKIFLEIDDFIDEKIKNDIKEIQWNELENKIKEKLMIEGDIKKIIF